MTTSKLIKEEDLNLKNLKNLLNDENVFVSFFETNDYSILDNKVTEEELYHLIKFLDFNYYNNNNNNNNNMENELLLEDCYYDMLKEYVEQRYPNNKIHKEVGVEVIKTSKNKIKLPHFLGSLNKLKTDKCIENWMSKYPKGPYIITPKLDGVSGLYTYKDGVERLMTRGDGHYGQDISYFIPYVLSYDIGEIMCEIMCEKIKKNETIAIRGEFIMRKSVFEEKYKNEFANSRNLVSGIINTSSKNLENILSKLRDVEFIAYEIIEPENMNSKEQLSNLHYVMHHTVPFKEYIPEPINETINEPINETMIKSFKGYLTEVLFYFKNDLNYEIDGIVVSDSSNIYKRMDENPKHMFAYKMVMDEKQMMEATVVDVIWNPSKDGYLKPQIQIEPIQLSGVEINYTTGFNGDFIHSNYINKGTILKIIRSGDVIPHIVEIVKCSQTPLMPENYEYRWNENHVDIILENKEDNIDVIEKNVTYFFEKLKIEGISKGIVKKIVSSFSHDNKVSNIIAHILNMEINDYLKIQGFKDKLSSKIYNNIKEKCNNLTMIELMNASNIFGRGFSLKRIEMIMNEYPDILFSQEPKEEKIKKIIKLKGFSDKTSELFVNSIPHFLEFVNTISSKINIVTNITPQQEIDIPFQTKNNNDFIWKDKTIVFTGIRPNKELILKMKMIGCKEGSKINKHTDALVIKNEDSMEEPSVKIKDAINLNIQIITMENFLKDFE